MIHTPPPPDLVDALGNPLREPDALEQGTFSNGPAPAWETGGDPIADINAAAEAMRAAAPEPRLREDGLPDDLAFDEKCAAYGAVVGSSGAQVREALADMLKRSKERLGMLPYQRLLADMADMSFPLPRRQLPSPVLPVELEDFEREQTKATERLLLGRSLVHREPRGAFLIRHAADERRDRTPRPFRRPLKERKERNRKKKQRRASRG